MDTLVEGGWPARAGVEMALWDILGKSLDVPLWVLLGGRSREGAVLSRSIHMASPDEMAAQAAGLVAEGYGCVKVRIGVGGPGADEAAVAPGTPGGCSRPGRSTSTTSTWPSRAG